LLRFYISRVENGHTVPAVETLEKMARALEVPMYRLFHDGEVPAGLSKLKPRKDDEFGSKGSEADYFKQTTILEFTKTLQADARTALGGMDTILKENEFWQSKAAKSSILLLNQIFGYDDAVPRVCRFYVEIDRDNKRLTYPEPMCKEIDTSSSFSIHIPKLMQSANIVEAVTPGSPQSLRLAYFEAKTFPVAQTLLRQTSLPACVIPCSNSGPKDCNSH